MPDVSRDCATLPASSPSNPLLDAPFLRAVLEAIPALVARIDSEQRVRYINHVAPDGLEQVIGRPVRDFIEPADYPRYVAAVARALRTGEVCSYSARTTREGFPGIGFPAAADYECHVVPIDEGDGRRGLCVVSTDVTSQMKREADLRSSEERLRLVLQATGLGLWTWDAKADRIEWDERMREIMGCEAMSSVEYQERLVHPDDREAVREEIAAARAAKPKFVEHRIVRPDGEIRWILPCGQHAKLEGDELLQMVGGALDVTVQHRATEQLRLAQKNELIGSLTSGIAHNFNNMLAIIHPALDLALQQPGAVHRQSIEDALQATKRASELVGQLMIFAGQRRAPVSSSTDLVQLIERTASMCQRTFAARVQIETKTALNSAHVSADPLAIEQVLMNVLINARDAVAEVERKQTYIRVELSEGLAHPPDSEDTTLAKYFCIRVDDNGVGMSDAVKRRVFEPFFTTKNPGMAAGLGLATSYGIVRDLGGFINVESQPLEGTSVLVFLPPTAARNLSAAPAAPEVSAAPSSTILVIDDEPAVRRVVELILLQRGHRVHLAPDGQAGVTQLDAGLRPDLIVLDRSMPGWTAKTTLIELRKRAEHVPILFFTGQEVTREERAQVQDVLYKPLSPKELIRIIERWLVMPRLQRS